MHNQGNDPRQLHTPPEHHEDMDKGHDNHFMTIILQGIMSEVQHPQNKRGWEGRTLEQKFSGG